MMAVLGKLAKETTVDATSQELLKSAAHYILNMRKLVITRLDRQQGWLQAVLVSPAPRWSIAAVAPSWTGSAMAWARPTG